MTIAKALQRREIAHRRGDEKDRAEQRAAAAAKAGANGETSRYRCR
jgi:hypothetical protein